MKDILILSRYEIKINNSLQCDILVLDEEVLAEFYNKKKEIAKQYRATLFLDGRYNLTSDKAVEELYEYLLSSHKIVGGVYSDCLLLNKSGEIMSYHVNQSYSPELVEKGVFVDSALMIRSQLYPEFDPEIPNLLIYDGFLSIAQKSPILRCPSFCFSRGLFFDIPTTEIKYVSKKHYESK